eukprot:8307945-Lingulodinium_polyedra.AAC.1
MTCHMTRHGYPHSSARIHVDVGILGGCTPPKVANTFGPVNTCTTQGAGVHARTTYMPVCAHAH